MPNLVRIGEGVFVGQGAKVRCFPSTDAIALNTLHCTTVHASDVSVYPFYISSVRPQSKPVGRSLRLMAQMTWFDARKCLLEVKSHKITFWGSQAPKTPIFAPQIGNPSQNKNV